MDTSALFSNHHGCWGLSDRSSRGISSLSYPIIPWLQSQKDLTHWGRVTHICVGKLTIIGSDNGLSPGRRQAIIWTNAGILLIGPLGTNFSETLIEIDTFSFKKMHLKMSSAKWRPFCLGLDVLTLKCWSHGWGFPLSAIQHQETHHHESMQMFALSEWHYFLISLLTNTQSSTEFYWVYPINQQQQRLQISCTIWWHVMGKIWHYRQILLWHPVLYINIYIYIYKASQLKLVVICNS